MTTWLFANFFATELTQSISAGSTNLTVPPSAAAKLPIVIAGSQVEIRLVLWDGLLPPEIVAVTANNQSGSMTIVRAKEGTTAQQWPSGTQVRSAITAEVMNAALAAFFDFTAVLNASFLKLTGGTLTGPLILNADPTAPLGAVTKQYADSIQGNKLPLAGGTMNGAINMNNNRILALPTPVSGTEPGTKGYVDTSVGDLNTALTNTINALNTTLTTNINNLSLSVNDKLPGAWLTGGTASAYTIASSIPATALTDGLTRGFRPHVTNTLNPTFKVDALTPKPLRSSAGTPLPPGFLIPAMPLTAVFSTVYDSWFLEAVYQNSFDFVAGDIKHSAVTADHGRWLLADGRQVGRTGDTGLLFSTVGTIWGVGDNVTTFNILDARGRVLAGRDDMGGAAASRITNAETGLTGSTLGAGGGTQSVALTTAQLAAHNHVIDITDPGHNHGLSVQSSNTMQAGGSTVVVPGGTTNTASAATGITAASTNRGGGATHSNLQPTSITNIFVRY